MKYRYLFVLLFALLFGNRVEANEETKNDISILAYDIPALLQADKRGVYDKLIQQVKDIEQKTWTYQVAPPARVDQMFDNKLVDCIIPIRLNI